MRAFIDEKNVAFGPSSNLLCIKLIQSSRIEFIIVKFVIVGI